MKEQINYYYNLFPERINKINNGYYFFIGKLKYFLLIPHNKENEFNLIITIYNEYKKRNILIDEIVINRDGAFITKINGNNYCLIRSVDLDNNSLEFIYNFDKIIKTNKKEELGYKTYDLLWGKKVDYYESVVNEIKDVELKKYFDYYIGLAENAISYVKNACTSEKDTYLTVQHKSLNDKFDNILNPFNLIVDYEIRDISNYIKIKYFNSCFSFYELDNIFKNNKFSSILYRLLFARLLYPDYYFELIDRDLKKQNVSYEIFNEIEDYEKFLLEMYEYICEYYPIPKIEWLYRK